MIDGVKLKIVSMALAYNLQRHQLLKHQYKITTDSETGLVIKYQTKYLGLTITIMHNKYITIEGSLHKFWTGGHNDTDFSYDDLCCAAYRLCELFGLDPAKMKIERFELGVNVRLNIPAVDFVDSVRCFDLLPFSYDQPIATKRHHGKYFIRTQYEVKCYCKSTLAKAEDKNLLRFEVRFRKMELIKELEIVTLADLLCPEKFALLSRQLLEYYDRVHLQEPTLETKSAPKPREKELLLRGYDAQYWRDLRAKISRQAIYKKKAKYMLLVSKYSSEDLKGYTRKLIEKKIAILVKVDNLTT